MLYPGATPEFRILVKQDDTQEFQVRYINISQGYTSKWQVIPVVKEETTESIK
jgi:hypothetical protein